MESLTCQGFPKIFVTPIDALPEDRPFGPDQGNSPVRHELGAMERSRPIGSVG